MGDSITFGTGSSTGSGYRANLRDQLTSHSEDVRFVGSQRSGEAPVREHEGHYGWKIGGLTGRTARWLTAAKPNVVLLHIGTNDMHDDYRADQAPKRLAELINEIVVAAPGVTVLVSSLVPSADPRTQERIARFNSAVPQVVTDYQDKAFQVEYVDMSRVTADDLRDDLHPNDDGYRKMADVFYRGIARAVAKGWVRERVAIGASPSGRPGTAIPFLAEELRARTEARVEQPRILRMAEERRGAGAVRGEGTEGGRRGERPGH
ncbi:hypothetical protein I5Q34_32995 [Streptomyces sp. AV19]|uniref:SGNH/GDSL hydrolase family protein n=1 Tax=Streptomyces sp. AV19 TaxID=2793068 RepID=UPI0018FE8758|nr:SGNH/GDSL hydrolase family protein [Streptomyces sp. AV19]MBH1939022.1 hypothetical protein [Streptomyces sp. AV19]MDG4532463.1 SGNH/GDSL hydrolase family protein [Streptomyces sp. AV19]